jgi:FkbM family methyltransferase
MTGYKKYPFKVPARVRFFNIFRYPFTFRFLENILAEKLARRKTSFWRKFMPPIYFYPPGSRRRVVREGVWYEVDISKLLEHSVYFSNVNDAAWENMLKLLKPGFKVIDAGANMGYLTLAFARQCSSGMVYSFEPDSENFKTLTRNVELNALRNVKLFNTALGDSPRTATLYKLYENNPGANRILPEAPQANIEHENVTVTTLDVLYEQGAFTEVDFMKVDVEGFEMFLLQGATTMIRKCQPMLFVELAAPNLAIHNITPLQLVDFIETLEYDVHDARNMQPIDKHNLAYTDIICFPKHRSF